MLKDKYKFTFDYSEANGLMLELERMFMFYGHTQELELKLPITVLVEFQKRLAGQLVFPSNKIKIHFKRAEALAFQVLFLGNIIENTSETMHIGHIIDTTL